MSTPVSGMQAFPTGSRTAEAELRSRVYQWVWRIQAAGLLVLTVMTFFPSWSHLQEYLFLSLFLTGCATAYGESRRLLQRSPLNLPIALWLGWILLSVPFALDPAYSFGEWRKVLVKVLWFYWAMLVLRNSEYDEMDRKVLAAVAWGSLLLCLYALSDFFARGGTWSDRVIRARAPSSDYNWLSSYMVMAVPMLIAAAVRAQRLAPLVFYAGATALALAAQGLSYTRAGWLALTAQGLAFGLFARNVRALLWLGAGSVVVVGLILAADQGGYQKDTRDVRTLKERTAVWSLMLQDIGEHPLVGVGYGTNTFMARFGDRPETVAAKGSHNFFLMTAMGSGIPALVFFTWVLAAGVRECLRLARASTDQPGRRAMMIGLASVVVGVAVRNFFDAMFLGSLACLFWILLGTGLAQVPERRPA